MEKTTTTVKLVTSLKNGLHAEWEPPDSLWCSAFQSNPENKLSGWNRCSNSWILSSSLLARQNNFFIKKKKKGKPTEEKTPGPTASSFDGNFSRRAVARGGLWLFWVAGVRFVGPACDSRFHLTADSDGLVGTWKVILKDSEAWSGLSEEFCD